MLQRAPLRAWEPCASLAPCPAHSNAASHAADIPACPGRDPLSVPGCGDDVFQKFKFAPPGFSLHLIFCPVTAGQTYCSMARAEEQGSLLPSTDPHTPCLPSYHSSSLPHKVVMRTTPLSGSQKKPCTSTGDLAQLQASPDPKLTPSFSSTLGSCCHTHPCTNIFYHSDFAAGSKLGGRKHLEQAKLLGEGKNKSAENTWTFIQLEAKKQP